MSDYSQLTGGPAFTAVGKPARGRIAVAPATAEEQMVVTLINYANDYSYDVPASNWMPRPERLPRAGDRCIVIFDDDGDAWVPGWGSG